MLSSVKSKMPSAKEKVAFYKRDAYDKLGSSSDPIPTISHKEEIPKARTQKPVSVRACRGDGLNHEAMFWYFSLK